MPDNGVLTFTNRDTTPSSPVAGKTNMYVDSNSSPFVLSSSGSNLPIATFVSGSPYSMTSDGRPGQIAFSGSYMYICITSGSWKRCSLSTF